MLARHRCRLSLAGALLAQPDLPVLDEPADGLDPDAQAWLRATLRSHAAAGGAALLSWHALGEVGEIALPLPGTSGAPRRSRWARRCAWRVSFLGVRNLAGTTAGDLQRALGRAGMAGIVAFLAGAAAAGSDRRHGMLPWLAVGSGSRAGLARAQALAVVTAAAGPAGGGADRRVPARARGALGPERRGCGRGGHGHGRRCCPRASRPASSWPGRPRAWRPARPRWSREL